MGLELVFALFIMFILKLFNFACTKYFLYIFEYYTGFSLLYIKRFHKCINVSNLFIT